MKNLNSEFLRREISSRTMAAGALLLSILGLALLLFYSQAQKPEQLDIGQIDGSHTGRLVETTGQIRTVGVRSGNVFITLCSSSCISIFIPSSSADDFTRSPYLLQKGERLAVRGIVREYKGELEIIPVAGGIELI